MRRPWCHTHSFVLGACLVLVLESVLALPDPIEVEDVEEQQGQQAMQVFTTKSY